MHVFNQRQFSRRLWSTSEIFLNEDGIQEDIVNISTQTASPLTSAISVSHQSYDTFSHSIAVLKDSDLPNRHAPAEHAPSPPLWYLTHLLYRRA